MYPQFLAVLLKMIVIPSHSSSSSLQNPCPSGTGIGYGEFNGTIFVICDAAFNHNNNSADPLALGLGLGLGIGIPMIAVLVWAVVFTNNWWCYRNKYEDRRHSIDDYRLTHYGASTPEEYVKLKLGPELFQQFIKGNLTNELKKKLFALREEHGNKLGEFEAVAHVLGNSALAKWINKLSYTTLQNEGLV